MNFFEKKKAVRFVFELEDGNQLQLDYLLQPNSLREKWINEIKTYQTKGKTSFTLNISNKNCSHVGQLIEKLNSIIQELNDKYESKILLMVNEKDGVNQKILNSLHEKFEEYGENKFSYLGKNVHYLWLQLNEWIHITEVAIETTEDKFPQYGAVITAYPPYPGRKLEEVDKLFLSTDFSWGHLYLGYNTLGKDYMSAVCDNDIRVILNKQIKVQERYSSEVWLCFQNKTYTNMQKTRELEFYQWYESLNQESQELIPIENLNTLGLGRYYLGHILINKDLLKFHPVAEDWWTDQKIQKQWNNEVFSKVKSVVNVKIYE